MGPKKMDTWKVVFIPGDSPLPKGSQDPWPPHVLGTFVLHQFHIDVYEPAPAVSQILLYYSLWMRYSLVCSAEILGAHEYH